MSTRNSAELELGRTPNGFCLRVVGRGTMRESLAVRSCVTEGLENSDGTFAVDLNPCDYLDSTFLGCLTILHKEFSMQDPPRFFVVASPQKSLRLLRPTRLDQLLRIVDDASLMCGDSETVSLPIVTAEEIGEHSMHCHRQLSCLDTPQREIFRKIADQLEHDLLQRSAHVHG